MKEIIETIGDPPRLSNGQERDHISLYVEGWINDLITLKARNLGISKSKLIRKLLKESFIGAPKPERFKDIGYYNDAKGRLRSIKN